MRKLFSDKAGATFNDGLPNNTINVRKDCVELVVKVGRGRYAITNLLSSGNGKMWLIANWGRYFERIKNPAVQLPRCKETCPTLYKLLTNSLDGISLAKRNDDSGYSICMQVPMPGVIPLLSITKELFEVNNDFVNTMIDIYNELSSTPPFPGWKDGLEEIWN